MSKLLKKYSVPLPPLHDVGDEDEDVGVFGADPVLDAGGEKAVVLFWSLFPSDRTVNLGEEGDGVLGDLTKVVIFDSKIQLFFKIKKITSTFRYQINLFVE